MAKRKAKKPRPTRFELVWSKGLRRWTLKRGRAVALMFPEGTTRDEAETRSRRHVFQVNQTKADYWRGWDPVRLWLCAERDKMGWTPKDIRKLTGNHMHGHWFGESQWVFISARNYAILQEAAQGKAFERPYEDLRAEYLSLQQQFKGEVRDDRVAEFQAARPFFDNAHDIMRDVWEFSRVSGDERYGHATPKPVDMMERIMRSSLRPAEICYEPFAGTGSTLMGAEAAGRVCYAMELQGVFVDVVVRRWQASGGVEARLASSDGPTFSEVAKVRGGAS